MTQATILVQGKMNDSNLLDEIEELNLAYLLLAQRILHEDRTSAMFRLKVDDEMADLLLSLNARQLSRLSRSNQLLCHFGYDNAEQLGHLTHSTRDLGLTQFHASLLMASQPLSAAAGGKR